MLLRTIRSRVVLSGVQSAWRQAITVVVNELIGANLTSVSGGAEPRAEVAPIALLTSQSLPEGYKR